jgi:cell shape-determining protein MreC
LYETGAHFAGFERVEAESERTRLAREVAQLRTDNARLQSALADRDRQLSVERATQIDLAKSVKTLQDESARLKEDLMFFRKVKPTTGNSSAVGIRR